MRVARAVDLGVRGQAVAEHGQRVDDLEDRARGVLAQQGGVVAVAARPGGGGEDSAGGRAQGHNGRRGTDLGQDVLGELLEVRVQGRFQRRSGRCSPPGIGPGAGRAAPGVLSAVRPAF